MDTMKKDTMDTMEKDTKQKDVKDTKDSKDSKNELESTPRRVRVPVNTANLETTRDAIVKEIGAIQLYPIEQIIGTVLAAVSDDDLKQVKKDLKIKSSKEWIMAEMNGKRPSESELTEPDLFASIAGIFKRVAEAVKLSRIADPQVTLLTHPSRPPKKPQGQLTSFNPRPDATYVRKAERRSLREGLRPLVDSNKLYRDIEPTVSWTDTAGTEEYKKFNGSNERSDVSLNFPTPSFVSPNLSSEYQKGHLQYVSSHGIRSMPDCHIRFVL